jgi:hypothetical protein
MFPWKSNLEYGDTFTKLFMHVSSRNMFPTIRNLQIRVHVYRPRQCCRDWLSTHTFLTMIIEESVCFISCEPFFFWCNDSYVVHTEYIFTCIQHFFQLNDMSDNLPEIVQILGHAHIICITVRENRIICCRIFCDLLLISAFERIFNVMQLILFKIKWHTGIK